MSRPLDLRNFTNDQIQQHQQLRDQLQKANAVAGQRLTILGALRPDQKRTERVYSDLANVVCWMNLLVGCCEEIANNALQRRFTRIEVVLGTTCEYCEETARGPGRSTAQCNTQALGVDRAWSVQVKCLSSLTVSTIYRTCACSSLSEFNEFPQCLADLVRALRRQQRYLERMSVGRAAEIVIIEDQAEVCSECGHKYGEPIADGDDNDDGSNSPRLR